MARENLQSAVGRDVNAGVGHMRGGIVGTGGQLGVFLSDHVL